MDTWLMTTVKRAPMAIQSREINAICCAIIYVNRHIAYQVFRTLYRCVAIVVLVTLACGCERISKDQIGHHSESDDTYVIFNQLYASHCTPPSEAIRGCIDRVIIEDYRDILNVKKIAEIDGESTYTKTLTDVIGASKGTLHKGDMNFALSIYYEEKEEPLYIRVKGKELYIEGEGTYLSQVDLEELIVGLCEEEPCPENSHTEFSQ